MKTYIIGASGSLGRALATAEAKNKSDLVLVASDARDLEALKSDLTLRFNINVEALTLDLSKAGAIDKVALSGDRYYFPVGFTLDNDQFGTSSENIHKVFQINLLSTLELISKLLKTRRETSIDIIAFGSIAETRGRSNNVFYSAAKRSLTSAFESLLHGCEQNNVKPYLFQIGYMKSQLSFGKKLLFPAADSSDIAEQVLHIVENKKTGIFYAPSFWVLICLALRLLPWSFYRKLKF